MGSIKGQGLSRTTKMEKVNQSNKRPMA